MRNSRLLAVIGFASMVWLLAACTAPTGTTTPTNPSGPTGQPVLAPPVVLPPIGSQSTGASYKGPYRFGKDATSSDIAAWDIDISPDGTGLPAGSGTPAQGAVVFAAKCAGCHGDRGQGGLPATGEVLVGTQPWFQKGNPAPQGARTIGNYWPYATTIFDYVRRAMPFTAPQSLTNDEVYAVTAWLLNQNKIIGDNDTMNAQTLPKVQMPNRNGFVPDPRPWPEVQ